MRPRPGLWGMMTPLNREIGGRAAAAVDAGAAGAGAEVFDRNRVEPRHHFVLQGLDQRRDDAGTELGARLGTLVFLVVDGFRHAHHIADRNAPALAREAVAAARAAHALEHAGAHQLLHHLLEIALRHALARGDLLGLHGLGTRVERDVDHRLERQQGFAGKLQHGSRTFEIKGIFGWPIASLLEAGGPEATRAARGGREFAYFVQLRLFAARDHELGDLRAARDAERCVAVIDQDRLHLAAIVAVDGAGRVEHGDAVVERKAGTWAHLGFISLRQRNRDAAGHRGARAGREFDVAHDGGEKIEAGGAFRRIVRQGGIGGMRQAPDRELHAAWPFSASAMRAARRRPTSRLSRSGQSSVPFAVIRCTVFLSPPITPVAGLTSLATIQSQPFFASLARACATTSSVSAAKPMTRRGRRAPWAMVERISGFCASLMSGADAFSRFFILLLATASGRQSATAAVNTATSAGRALSQAASISRAVWTLSSLTRAGGAISTGPETSVVSAPACASASAMAYPCLAEERVDM